jgi:hypothetical protein
MKQKKYNWIFYILILAVICGVFYVATKDITPISQEIEKSLKIEYKK